MSQRHVDLGHYVSIEKRSQFHQLDQVLFDFLAESGNWYEADFSIKNIYLSLRRRSGLNISTYWDLSFIKAEYSPLECGCGFSVTISWVVMVLVSGWINQIIFKQILLSQSCLRTENSYFCSCNTIFWITNYIQKDLYQN